MDFLDRHGQDDWWLAVNNLAPLIHEVDRDATKIWFYFWPLWVRSMLQDAEANPQLLEELEFKGVARLEEHIDSSHALARHMVMLTWWRVNDEVRTRIPFFKP